MKLPNESKAYGKARNQLLRAEIALRKQVEKVAAQRRKLPAGGEVPEDYAFTGEKGKVRLSELFRRGDTLVVYSFMFAPERKEACPGCTHFLDGIDGAARHIRERLNFVVVAKSPLPRIQEYARSRGWGNFELLSSEGTTYNRDYFGESADGSQMPILNVFRNSKTIRHFYATELLFAKSEPGQNARHVDPVWSLWNLLDFTPEGRGKDWYPKLDYRI